MNPHDHPTALLDLQDSIYREKVMRARRMTADERWAAGFEITDEVFERMLTGAMWQLDTEDRSLGWEQVRIQLARLRRMHDHGRYVNSKPA